MAQENEAVGRWRRQAVDPEGRLLAGTRSTRMAAIWQANFERQVCGTETGFT